MFEIFCCQDPHVAALFRAVEKKREEFLNQAALEIEGDDDADMYENDVEAPMEGEGLAEERGPMEEEGRTEEKGPMEEEGVTSKEDCPPDAPLHRYRTKATLTSVPSQASLAMGSDGSSFEPPTMTDEQKEELAEILKQIAEMQLSSEQLSGLMGQCCGIDPDSRSMMFGARVV